MHKAWRSIEEMPYGFSRSSVKFQGHKGQKILMQFNSFKTVSTNGNS